MKVLVTILILAALLGLLLYFAHGAIRKFDETVSQEEDKDPEAVDAIITEMESAIKELNKAAQEFVETQETLSSSVQSVEQQVKSQQPRDPKTGRFIKKQ